MALPDRIRNNLHQCLADTPVVLKALLGSLPADSDFWDLRPGPDRFSPREVLAHIADWNSIFEERISKTLSEDHPTIHEIDEEHLAIEHNYATQDPLLSLSEFCTSRSDFVRKVVGFLKDDWAKSAHRDDMGDVTVEAQIVLVSIHDAYHTRQIAEYLEIWQGH